MADDFTRETMRIVDIGKVVRPFPEDRSPANHVWRVSVHERSLFGPIEDLHDGRLSLVGEIVIAWGIDGAGGRRLNGHVSFPAEKADELIALIQKAKASLVAMDAA